MYKNVMSYLKSSYAIISICCMLALVIMLGCSWNSDDNDEYIIIDDFSRNTEIKSLEQQETLSLSDNSSLKYQPDTFDISTRLVFYKKATKQDESSVYGAAVSDVYSVTAYKDVFSSIDKKTRTVPLNSIEKPFELTFVSNTSKPSTNDVYLGIKDYQDKSPTGWEYTKIDDFNMNSDKSVFVYKSGNNYIVSTTKLNSNFAIFTSDEIKKDSNYLGGVKNISLELEPKEYDVVKVIDAKTGKETITYGSDTLVNAIVDVENPSLLDIKDIETVITFISDCPNPIPGGIVVNGNTYPDTVNSINGEPQADAKGNKYTHVIKINDKTISPEGNVFKIKIETKGKSLEEFPANFTVKTIFNVDNGNVRYRTSGEAKAERVQAVNIVAEMLEPENGAIDIPTWYPFEATDKSKSYIRFKFDSEFAWTPEMNSKVTVKKGNDKVDCDVVPEKGSLKLVLQTFAYASTYTVSFASGIVDKNDKQLKPADFSFSTVKELPILGFRTYFVPDIKMPKDEKNTGLDEAVIVFFVEKINGGKTEIGKYVTLDSVPLGKLESDGIINFDAFTLEDASKIDDIAAKYDATEIANKIKDNIDLVNPNLTLLIMKAKSHWIGGGHNYLFSIKRDYLFNPEKTMTVYDTNWSFKTVNNGKPTNQPVIDASCLVDGKATLRPDLTVSFGTKISDKDADNIKNLIVVKDESNESVDYNPSWNSGKDALTIKFDEDVLNPDSKYVIHMSSSISADNGDVFNPFNDMSFDTLPAMTVESFTPADNATGFATRETIVVTFSGDADFTKANVIDGVKITKSGSSENIINDMKIATDSKKLMLTPATGLDVKTTYQITVLSNKLKNLKTGQMVAGEKSSKFTTVAEIKASINFQNQTKCFVGGDKTATVLNPEFDIDFGTNVGDTDATERLIVIDKSGVTVPESKYEKIWKDGNKSVLTIRFKEDLEGEAEYTVKMTGNAKDEKGKTIARMDDFSFTTLPATMTLTAWSPYDASTTDEDDFVESNTNIWLSFQDNKVNLANFTIDEIKNHLSVRNKTEDVALGLTSKFDVATNSERIILTPSGDGMTKDRVFEVTLTTGMKNVYHQTVSTPNKSFSFRTVDQASTIFVSGVTPTDETGKKTPVDTKISISLTDDIDWVVGTSEEKVQLVAPDKSLVACNCSYTNRVITLTPIQFLAYETRYQVVVKRGLKKGLERVAPNDENYFTTGSNSIASHIYDKNGVEIVTISNAEGTEYSTTMTVDLDGNFEIKFDDIINWNKDWESNRIQGYKDIVGNPVKWSDLRFTAGLQYTYPTVSQKIDHLEGHFNETLTYDTTYAIAILKDVTNPETGDSSPRKIFLFHTKGEGIPGSLSQYSGFSSSINVGACASDNDHYEHTFYLKFNKPINRSDYAGSQVFKIYEKGHPENTVTIDMSNVYWTEADKNICIKFNKNGLNAGHKLALPGKTYILEYDSSKSLIDSTGEKVNIEKLVTDGKFIKNGDLYQFEFTTTAS